MAKRRQSGVSSFGFLSHSQRIQTYSNPHSNATCERIFSLMTSAWRKDRNRLMLKNLESELMIKHNFDMNCTEFQTYLKNEGVKILNEVKSSDKY